MDNLAKLEQFVSLIEKDIPLQRRWYTKRSKEAMSRFANAVASQGTGYPFVKSELKTVLVESEIPFTVTKVRGPIHKEVPDGPRRMKEIDTYYLDIQFDPIKFSESRDIEEFMTLSFTAGYEGRDKLIEALRGDIEEFDVGVENVILTGNKDWYSLDLAS